MRHILTVLALCFAMQSWAVKVGVLLNFKDNSSTGKAMVEFYRGILLAVDSVKREGISVEVVAIDCGTTALDLDGALGTGGLEDAYVIFGPTYSEQTQVLAQFCQANDVRLVTPFSKPANVDPQILHTASSNPYGKRMLDYKQRYAEAYGESPVEGQPDCAVYGYDLGIHYIRAAIPSSYIVK